MRTRFAKRAIAAVAAWLAALCLAGTPPAGAAKLTLLHVNDLYEIAPKRGRGGFAPLMTLLEAERATAAGAAGATVTTFGGDLISPSIMSALMQGAQMIDLANAVGIDYAVPGNHDLDFGVGVFAKRVAESRFTWLGANLRRRDGGAIPGLGATATRDVDGITVGFFGLLTPDTATIAKGGAEVSFTPPLEAAAAAVAALRRQGAEVIIALTHLDLARDRALVRAVKGIDLVLGGHDHAPMAVMESGVLILKSGSDAGYLAAVTLDIERVLEKRGMTVRVTPTGWRHLSTAGIAPHPETAARVKVYEARLEGALAAVVGRTETGMDSRRAIVRRSESAMGNLIADAMRGAAGADIALINGGGIRGNRVYTPGSTLTRRDIIAELPFGDVTVVLALDGAAIRAALEHAVGRVEHMAGRFLQVSGLRFSWSPAAAPGRRVGPISINGRPLDGAKTYRVAAGAFIAGGGDGFAMLKTARRMVDAEAGAKVAAQVIDHIAAKGTVGPRIEGRIRETR